MGRDLVPASNGVLGHQRQPFDRAAARAHSRLDVVAGEHVGDTPPARARAIFKMAVEAGIGQSDDAMLHFVNGFVVVVAIGYRVFAALLEIDDKRHGDARVAGPVRIRFGASVTPKIPAIPGGPQINRRHGAPYRSGVAGSRGIHSVSRRDARSKRAYVIAA